MFDVTEELRIVKQCVRCGHTFLTLSDAYDECTRCWITRIFKLRC